MFRTASIVAAIAVFTLTAAGAEPMSPDARKAWDKGFELMQKGEHVEAFKHFETAMQLAPQAYEVWTEYVVCLRKLNRLPRSAKAGWQAVQLAPEKHEAWNTLGNTFLACHAWDQAYGCFLMVDRLAPDKAWAARNHLALAYRLWEHGRCERAREVFRHAASVDPTNGLPLVDQGALLFHMDKANMQQAKGLVAQGIYLIRTRGTPDQLLHANHILAQIDGGETYSPGWSANVSWQPLPAELLAMPKEGALARLSVPGSAERHYLLPKGDTVCLTTPEAWWERLGDDSPWGHFFTMQFGPVEGSDFQVLWSARYAQKSDAEVREQAQRVLNTALPTAVETNVPLVPVEAEHSKGFAFCITDKNHRGADAPPGDYPFLISITLQTGNIRSLITVLSQTKDPAFIQRMLDLWKGLRYRDKPD